jgi:hypothetical protein
MTVVDGLSKPNFRPYAAAIDMQRSPVHFALDWGCPPPLCGGWDGRVGLPSFRNGMGPASW